MVRPVFRGLLVHLVCSGLRGLRDLPDPRAIQGCLDYRDNKEVLRDRRDLPDRKDPQDRLGRLDSQVLLGRQERPYKRFGANRSAN